MKGLEEFFDYYDSHQKCLTEYSKFMKDVEDQRRSTSQIILDYYACLAEANFKHVRDVKISPFYLSNTILL